MILFGSVQLECKPIPKSLSRTGCEPILGNGIPHSVAATGEVRDSANFLLGLRGSSRVPVTFSLYCPIASDLDFEADAEF